MASNWIHGNLEVKEHRPIKTQVWYFTFKGKTENTNYGINDNHFEPAQLRYEYEFKIVFENERFQRVEFDMRSPYDRDGWLILKYISEKIADIEDGFKNKEG